MSTTSNGEIPNERLKHQLVRNLEREPKYLLARRPHPQSTLGETFGPAKLLYWCLPSSVVLGLLIMQEQRHQMQAQTDTLYGLQQ